jgi:ABC-type Fe3+-hydroxamate transport system substrate-binding protein
VLALLALAVLVLGCSAAPAAPPPVPAAPAAVRELVDDWGRPLRLPAPPLRIVSLAPHATEWLAAFGALPWLIAVDPQSDHPAAVRALPRVGAWPAPDVEALARLRPDLVVVWGAGLRRETLTRLEALGIAVLVSEPRSLADLPRAAARMAPLAPDPERARAIARGVGLALDAIGERYRGAAPVPLFIQLASRPLLTLSDRDPMAQALRLCGATNLFGDAAGISAQVGLEAVLARGPVAVLLADPAGDDEPWRGLGLLAPAGRLARLRAEAALARPGPRLPAALAPLCEAIDGLRRPAGATSPAR